MKMRVRGLILGGVPLGGTFERVINGLGGQNCSQLSILTWSSGIQCKNKKIFYGGSQEQKRWSEIYNVV